MDVLVVVLLHFVRIIIYMHMHIHPQRYEVLQTPGFVREEADVALGRWGCWRSGRGGRHSGRFEFRFERHVVGFKIY